MLRANGGVAFTYFNTKLNSISTLGDHHSEEAVAVRRSHEEQADALSLDTRPAALTGGWN